MSRSDNVARQLVSNEILSPSQESVERRANAVQIGKDYLSLTKPGVILLLLVSTCCPMILASAGGATFEEIALALIAGALVSGSAAAFNCIWDHDIDAVMERTKDRPVARGRISIPAALFFSVAIGMLGLVIFAVRFNFLSAGLALFGHVFYVFVYTMWLKRTTPQNIVIGGAAGAVPPLVGWAAVTGSIDLTALALFLVIFLWTPPHFWALALNKNADYRKVGIPMLPVVAGDRVTVNQMLVYAALLLPTGALLVWSHPALGMFTLVGVSLLGFLFLYKVGKLSAALGTGEEQTKRAWEVFGFSLIYLALYFVCLVVDSVIV
ncbi:MAG: protoheme IX farnesyltransferase [Deltaproteobacteria bacterium]|nr:protoheme IX farnesyltransferase [Deltaproteobacteria bacterium]